MLKPTSNIVVKHITQDLFAGDKMIRIESKNILVQYVKTNLVSVNEEGPFEPAVVYVYHEKWMSSTSQD